MKEVLPLIPKSSHEVKKMEWSAPCIKKMPAPETYFNIGALGDGEGFTSQPQDASF
jgi:hypothetical protein